MYVYQIIVRLIQYADVYLPLCPVRHCIVRLIHYADVYLPLSPVRHCVFVVAPVNVRLTDKELRIYYYYHHY